MHYCLHFYYKPLCHGFNTLHSTCQLSSSSSLKNGKTLGSFFSSIRLVGICGGYVRRIKSISSPLISILLSSTYCASTLLSSPPHHHQSWNSRAARLDHGHCTRILQNQASVPRTVHALPLDFSHSILLWSDFVSVEDLICRVFQSAFHFLFHVTKKNIRENVHKLTLLQNRVFRHCLMETNSICSDFPNSQFQLSSSLTLFKTENKNFWNLYYFKLFQFRHLQESMKPTKQISVMF